MRKELVSRVILPSVMALCSEWLPAVEIGRLETRFIDEASGLAVGPSCLYHINDSGGGPYFFVTQPNGEKTVKIKVRGFKPWDTEDLSRGPCPLSEGKTCLAIADIGDNLGRRREIEIVFITEQKDFPTEVDAHLRLRLKYPDGARNSEAFAVHPSGDLVIVSKGTGEKEKPVHVYRLKKSAIKSGQAQILEKIGSLDIAALIKSDGLGAQVTSLSISNDGKRFLLLTYGNALEIQADLSQGQLPVRLEAGRDFRMIALASLPQQESISYDGADFIYSTEVFGSGLFAQANSAPLMRVRCKR